MDKKSDKSKSGFAKALQYQRDKEQEIDHILYDSTQRPFSFKSDSFYKNPVDTLFTIFIILVVLHLAGCDVSIFFGSRY